MHHKHEKSIILFYGQPRFLFSRLGYTNTLKKIKNANIEPFFCFWYPDKDDWQKSASWAGVSSDMYHKVRENFDDFVDKHNCLVLKQLDFHVEIEKITDRILKKKHSFSPEKYSTRNLKALLSQLFILEMGAKFVSRHLNEHNIEPVFLITTRTDLWLQSSINLNAMNNNKIIVSNEHPRFPDNFIIYPGNIISKLDYFSSFFKIFNELEDLSAEQYKEKFLQIYHSEIAILPIKLRYLLIRSKVNFFHSIGLKLKSFL